MPFKSILCPTDLSPMSVEALRKAVELARTFDAKLTLLHIHEYLMDEKEMIMLRVSVTDYKKVRNKRLVEIEKKMAAEMTEAGGGDLDVDYLQREGIRPYKEILKVVEEIDAGLIVMATNGRSAIDEHFLGSNAENVIRHAKCAVLTIRVPE